jgi:hypothetical protein
VSREFPESFSSALLGGRLTSKVRMNMLLIHRFYQASKFPADITRSSKWAFEQNRLKPAIEVFYRTIPVRFLGRNEYHLYSESEARSNQPREKPGGLAKATELTAIIELHLGGEPQLLPRMDDEVKNRIHLATLGEFHIHGMVENVFTDQKVVAGGITG